MRAEDSDADTDEPRRLVQSSLPATALDDFDRSFAHRIAGFPAAGRVAIKDRVNAIALAAVEDFRRDSDHFAEGGRNPEAQERIQTASSAAFRPEMRK